VCVCVCVMIAVLLLFLSSHEDQGGTKRETLPHDKVGGKLLFRVHASWRQGSDALTPLLHSHHAPGPLLHQQGACERGGGEVEGREEGGREEGRWEEGRKGGGRKGGREEGGREEGRRECCQYVVLYVQFCYMMFVCCPVDWFPGAGQAR